MTLRKKCLPNTPWARSTCSKKLTKLAGSWASWESEMTVFLKGEAVLDKDDYDKEKLSYSFCNSLYNKFSFYWSIEKLNSQWFIITLRIDWKMTETLNPYCVLVYLNKQHFDILYFLRFHSNLSDAWSFDDELPHTLRMCRFSFNVNIWLVTTLPQT